MDREPETVPDDFGEFDATLSLTDPIGDYTKLMNEKVKVDAFVPTEMMYLIWDKVSAGARKAVWELLFNSSEMELEKAAKFLKMHKDDACFYSPWDYNDWIVEVRNELLRRGMLDFWKNEIVPKELGPAWARDSDLFDDMDDPEPANFYNFGGCKAPWLKKDKDKQAESSPSNLYSFQAVASPKAARDLKKISKKGRKAARDLKMISKETPLDDYKYYIKAQTNIDPTDKDAYKEIFAQVRDLIWELLFSDSSLPAENWTKISALLEAYKRDARFYSPYDYNEWIMQVRDELFKRKHLDFWQNVIVSKHLKKIEDPNPLQFYESDTDLMKQTQNK